MHLNAKATFFLAVLFGASIAFQNCSEKTLDNGEDGGFVLGSYASLTGPPCERFGAGLKEVGDRTYEIDFDEGGSMEPTHIRCLDHTGGKSIELTFVRDAFNLNLFLLLKEPAGIDLDITIHVPSGVVIGSIDPRVPAIKTGRMSVGSTFTLRNSGRVQGAGGRGGHGGACGTPSLPGEKGGVAIEVTIPSTIDTTAGEIFGGGGGGGGGGDMCQLKDGEHACSGGGAGGGGAGTKGGKGGSYTKPRGTCNKFNSNFPGENGLADSGGPSMGELGGRGGDPGEPGSDGLNRGLSIAIGQKGGEAGEAIVKNGHNVEVLGQGNVRGPILEGSAPERDLLPF